MEAWVGYFWLPTVWLLFFLRPRGQASQPNTRFLSSCFRQQPAVAWGYSYSLLPHHCVAIASHVPLLHPSYRLAQLVGSSGVCRVVSPLGRFNLTACTCTDIFAWLCWAKHQEKGFALLLYRHSIACATNRRFHLRVLILLSFFLYLIT